MSKNPVNQVPQVPKVWDKLSLLSASGQEIGTLDRQAFAMTASYDLKRVDGQKFGRAWAGPCRIGSGRKIHGDLYNWLVVWKWILYILL